MDKQNFVDRQVRIARTCESFSDYETGCCPIFSCELQEWCDRGFKKKPVSSDFNVPEKFVN